MNRSGDGRIWGSSSTVRLPVRSILDTNIISQIAKPVPSPSLVAWMIEQADRDLFIASLTLAVAEVNDCVVVTDKDKDFIGIDIINPIRESPR